MQADKQPTTPFCWLSKPMLRHLREQLDGDAVGSGTGVYLALAELASDFEASTFKVSHAAIRAKCGYSRSTVISRLEDLERIGAVKIHRSEGVQVPNTYTLLDLKGAIRSPAPWFNNQTTLSGKRTALSKRPPLALGHVRSVPSEHRKGTAALAMASALREMQQ